MHCFPATVGYINTLHNFVLRLEKCITLFIVSNINPFIHLSAWMHYVLKKMVRTSIFSGIHVGHFSLLSYRNGLKQGTLSGKAWFMQTVLDLPTAGVSMSFVPPVTLTCKLSKAVQPVKNTAGFIFNYVAPDGFNPKCTFSKMFVFLLV